MFCLFLSLLLLSVSCYQFLCTACLRLCGTRLSFLTFSTEMESSDESEKIRKYRRLAAEAVMVVEDRDEEILRLKAAMAALREQLSGGKRILGL